MLTKTLNEKNIFLFFACVIAFLSPVRLWIPELSVFFFIFWLIFRVAKKDFSFFEEEKKGIFLSGCLFFLWTVFTAFFRDVSLGQELSNSFKYFGIVIFPLLFARNSILTKQVEVNYVGIFLFISLSIIGIYSIYVAYSTGNWYYAPFLGNFPISWFSSFLGIAIIFGLYMFFNCRSRVYTFLVVFLLLFFWWLVFLISFRRHFLALGAVLIILMCLQIFWKKFTKRSFLFLIIGCVSVTLIFQNPRIKAKLKSRNSDIRFVMWDSARQLSLQNRVNFLCGYGREKVRVLYQEEMKRNPILASSYLVRNKITCHNDYLDIILQYGVVGLLLFLFFLLNVLVYGYKKKNIWLLLFLVFYFVEAMAGSYFFDLRAGKFAFFFWLFIFFLLSDRTLVIGNAKEKSK